MSKFKRQVDVVVGSAVEELYLNLRDLRGFQGVDIGQRAGAGEMETVFRLHLAPNSPIPPAAQLPQTHGGLPVIVTRGRYSTVPTPGPVRVETSHYVTGGAPCTTASRGLRVGRQVTLMASDRADGQIGLLTAVTGFDGRPPAAGQPVFRSFDHSVSGEPIARVRATCIGRSGLAAFARLVPGQCWLPIERPENLTVTSLRRPVLGEHLRVASGPATVDGIGIYRVLSGGGAVVDVEGFRTRSDTPLPAGALVYDELRWSGVGLVSACMRSEDGAFLTVNSELARVMAALELRIAGYEDLLNGRPEVRVRTQAEPRATCRSAEAILGDPREQSAVRSEQRLEVDPLAPNDRADIATKIWPRLRGALDDVSQTRLRGITDRIERIAPAGRALRTLAAALNASADIGQLGLRAVREQDFAGCATADQVCERINDILAENIV